MKNQTRIALLLALASTLSAQEPRERMQDLDESRAAGKVRWLQQRWDAGEIDVREATDGILEGFEHPWIGVRIVVVQHITPAMDTALVRDALVAELRRFRIDLARHQPGVPQATSENTWQLFLGDYTREFTEKATAFADDTVAAALIECANDLDAALPEARLAPGLIAALGSIGTREALEAAVGLHERFEERWIDALQRARKVRRDNVFADAIIRSNARVTWPSPITLVSTEEVLRTLHAPMQQALLRNGATRLPDFSLDKPSARAFRTAFKRIARKLPEAVEPIRSDAAEEAVGTGRRRATRGH